MRFTPKTEDQLQREMLLDPGVYDFEVLSAENKQSKSGNDMIAITIKVFRPDGSSILVNDWLLEKMQFKLIHFCRTTGLDAKYDTGEVQATDCLMQTGKVQIIIQEQPGYAPKNAVKDYVAPKSALAGMGPNAPVAVQASAPATVKQAVVMSDDEPPF